MADFQGFMCEGCGSVWTLDKRTKVTMRFEQTEFCDFGSFHRDLCPNCIAEPFGWIPSKRNRNATEPRPPTDPRVFLGTDISLYKDPLYKGD